MLDKFLIRNPELCRPAGMIAQAAE